MTETEHCFSPVYRALGFGGGEDRHTGLLSPPQTHLAKSGHHACLCGEQNPAQLLASICLEQFIISQEPQLCSQWLSWSLSIPPMTVLIDEHHREPICQARGGRPQDGEDKAQSNDTKLPQVTRWKR